MEKQIYIVVIDSGFVFIGKCKRIKHEVLNDCIAVTDCYNIERWGTTEGLAQLSNEGKQTNTILRYEGSIFVPLNKLNHLKVVSETAAKSFGYGG